MQLIDLAALAFGRATRAFRSGPAERNKYGAPLLEFLLGRRFLRELCDEFRGDSRTRRANDAQGTRNEIDADRDHRTWSRFARGFRRRAISPSRVLL